MKFIAKSLFLLFSQLSIVFTISAQTETISVEDFVNQSINGLPTTADEVSAKFLNPLIGGGTMTTTSGTEFQAQLMCPTSNSFLEVFAQPSSTGDLGYLQFSRDTNLDGTIDSVSTFPKPTSGVCANGIISCKAGTWEDCVGYRWNADDDKLSLQETGVGNLGGCYCINKSCTDASMSSRIISSIVKDLGSSAAQTLANANPQYTISSAITNGPTAKFYGQKLAGCGNGTPNKYANYYNNPAQIETETNNLKTQTEGIYQLVLDSASAKNNLSTIRSCKINRNITTKHDYKWKDVVISRNLNSWDYRYYELTIRSIDTMNRMYVTSQRSGSACTLNYSFGFKNANIGENSAIAWVNHGCRATVNIEGKIREQYCATGSEYISNQCESTQDDKKCKLKNETIDGVQTYQNFQPTGKTPIETEREFGGSSCGLKVTRNWWEIQREYECDIEKEFDFTKGLNRVSKVQETTTQTSFDDVIDGVTTSRDLDISNITNNNNSCTNACKTKRIKQGSTVSSDGVKSSTGQEFETLYRKCIGENQNICPNEVGESIISQCGCLNEFGEVSSMMNAMRYAAQDLICTTGNPGELNSR